MSAVENKIHEKEMMYPVQKSGVFRGNGLSPSEKKALQDSIKENREALILMARG